MNTKDIIRKLSKKYGIKENKFFEALKYCSKSFIQTNAIEEAYADFKSSKKGTEGEVHALVRMIELASAKN